MRTLVVLLSIAAVLACPYQCAVKLAAAQGIGVDQKPACCEQCQARETTQQDQNQTPTSPGPDEDGCWCLCEGAVFDAGSRSLVDDSVQVSLWTWASGLAESPDDAAPTPSFDCAGLPPPLDGRLTRIAIHSLLL
jgi:hypothetical protein